MISKFKLDNKKNTIKKESINRKLEVANNYAGELSIEILPLDSIELDPENQRELTLTLLDATNGIRDNDPEYEKKKQDWKSLESLSKTIKNDQLINPIYVYRYGNKCRLIAGERRTLASAIAGKKEIIARIASSRPIGTKLRVLQWIENNERSDLRLSERISSLEAIIHEYLNENSKAIKVTSKLLHEITGISDTQARRYLLILNAKPEIKKAIFEGKLENIKAAEMICSIKSDDKQKVILEAAISGLPFDSLSKLKKELESDKKVKKIRRKKNNGIKVGHVRPNILKIIIEALMFSNKINADSLKQINFINESIAWENKTSTEKGFKKIIELLENES